MYDHTKEKPKRVKRIIGTLASLLILFNLFIPLINSRGSRAQAAGWQVKSIDTQIISKCWNNVSQDSINTQVQMLKNLGVNYIAIGTPYDRPDEMAKWVNAIHNTGLNVWYRSHWLNWEGDEGQTKNMTPDQYLTKTKQFVLDHPNFFKAGDSFTFNVEAENAGVGSGQAFGNWDDYKRFLTSEIDMGNDAFNQIGLGGKVKVNWLSTNGWIAENVIDSTLAAKIGLLTVDHYSNQGSGGNLTSVSQLAQDMSNDLDKFYNKWHIPIMIGEWGYNINQDVSDDQQKQAVQAVFEVFKSKSYIYGVSYWDHMGNNTRIINDSSGTPTTLRPAADVIKSYFTSTSTPSTPPPADTNTNSQPTNTTDKVISTFETGTEGWNTGSLVAGYNSSKALQLTNPTNGSVESKKLIGGIPLDSYKKVELDINLNGTKLLSGDASALYFDQGGWKWVSLTNYVQNGQNGWQHVSIPLSDFKLIPGKDAAYLGVRFWNNQTNNYQLDNIKLATGTSTSTQPPAVPTPDPVTPPAPPTPPSDPVSSKIISDFEGSLNGWSPGEIIQGLNSSGALKMANQASSGIESKKMLNGLVVGGYNRLELDINLNGTKLLSGDASALYFDQGGWKWVSLTNYVQNGQNGWQHVSIPLSDFKGLNPQNGLASIGLRFWNSTQASYTIDNIILANR